MTASSALITLDQSLASESKWLANRERLLTEANAITSVESDADLERSSAIQTRISKHIKALDKMRKELTEPLDAAKKQIMAQQKDLIATLDTELSRLKKVNDSYATRRLEEQEAEKKSHEEIVSHETIDTEIQMKNIFGNSVQFDPSFIPPAPEVHKPTTTAGRTVIRWEFEIIDPVAVPREFLSVDEVKIRKYRDYQIGINQEPSIPGVKFTKKVSVESR